MGESLVDLQKQKEDIQILLSTLEEAFRDASITKEHYDEVKEKNQKRLKEIDTGIAKMEKPSKPVKGKDAKPGKSGTKETKEPVQSTPAEAPAASPSAPPTSATEPSPAPGEPPGGDAGYSGIPQPLTDVAGSDEAEPIKPDKAPGGARQPEPGSLRYTSTEIKEMLGKIIKEIKPQGIEVIPRVDKIEVQLEKLKAYIEAMKDERSGGTENTQRLTEELGELRSSLSGLDRKVSESEMKVLEISGSLGDLRPARFLKSLEEESKTIKIHDARLDKTDDLISAMLKKLGQIEEVLKRLGSLEKIVSFSKEAAKRLLEIENREKKINRIADKIDGIFMELNKRLDEFVLYKAKQDTLDELSQEMMKSLDDISTKLEKYAEKGDLDMLKDMFQTELASLRTSAGTSPQVQKYESQKTEIEGLIAMLDEQFKAGGLPEKEYNKTKQINLNRLKDLDRKIEAAKTGEPAETAVSAPEQWAEDAALPGAAQKPATSEAAEPETPAPKKKGPGPSKPGTSPTEGKPTDDRPTDGKTPTKGTSPSSDKPTEGDKPTNDKSPTGDKQSSLMAELEDSLMKGLISKEAFEKTKKLIKHEK